MLAQSLFFLLPRNIFRGLGVFFLLREQPSQQPRVSGLAGDFHDASAPTLSDNAANST